MSVKKPIVLVDGSSYLYRAFHALPALTNSKGQATGAIYGIINMLKRIIADYGPQYMAVVFDAKGKTFRDDIYQAYKATRSPMPQELVSQIEPIHKIIKAMGIPLLMIEGVEADDVIGTLSAHAKAAQFETIISTGDKDLAQLVDEEVKLINTMTNTLLDIEGVKEKFGIPPGLIVDYLSLIGDTSDNIPGVPKVGPKTAVKWLLEYGNLDNIIANAAKISGKVGENLRNTIDQFPLIKSLVTIKMDVDLPVEFDELKIKPKDKAVLIESFKEMEFKTWLSELLNEVKDNQAESHFTLVETKALLKDLLQELSPVKQFALEIMTTSADYMSAKLMGIALAIPEKSFYLPFNQPKEAEISEDIILAALKPVFENKEIKKITHNAKYLLEIFANAHIHLEGAIYDTMLESYILDSASNAHDLDSLTLKYLGKRILSLAELAGKGSKQLALHELDKQKVAAYVSARAESILGLQEKLIPKINAESGLKAVFENIEIPLLSVLAEIERNGVLIDPDILIKHGQAMQKRLDELEKEAFQLAGKTFNLNSPKQLQDILFQVLKLPVLQKTPTGQASTADHVLQELALEFALPKLIIEYRSLSKLISTYTSRLVEQVDPSTGRIHTFYNQSATSTGRLSSSEPNLQNIPIRSVEGRRIRQAFIPPKGFKMVSADYSQIELRIMAHISKDPNLLHAFSENIDVHLATASEVWSVPLKEVTAEMRRNAKAINFGLIYGMSAFGLTRQLGIDRHSAQQYIDKYFERYPKVKAYMDNTRATVKEKGYVETLWGRRLYLPDIHASQIPRQKAAERAAINAPLQGSAADIIKMAMINLNRWIKEHNIKAKMIMQVHDELVFEVAEEEVNRLIEAIKKEMTTVVKLQVPLLVSIGSGDNWDAASAH